MNSRIFWLIFPLPWFMIGVFIWMLALPAGAVDTGAIFTVNSAVDATDAVPGDGICETGGGNGVCTLRAAIQESNALTGTDTIEIPADTYLLTIPGQDENAAATGDLDITESVIIQGDGRDSTVVSGSDLDRVFHVLLPDAEIAQIADLSIRDGDPRFVPGGGIYLQSGQLAVQGCNLDENFAGQGGGVYNAGVMTITNTIIQNNIGPEGGGLYSADSSHLLIQESQVITNGAGHGGGIYLNQDIVFGDAPAVSIYSTTIGYNGATYGGGMYVLSSRLFMQGSEVIGNGSAGGGGGILSAGSIMTVTRSTIAHNYVNSDQGEGGGISAEGTSLALYDSTIHNNMNDGATSHGGGLDIFGWSTIVNTTFSHNHAAQGGAIRFGIGNHFITNTTIVSNTAFYGGGIYDDPVYAGSATLYNTLVALNGFSDNCEDNGQIHSSGYNLESADTCDFNGPGDLINTDPLVGLLQDNGGPTWTHALMDGSPAIDAANNPGCPATDQRGVARPVDGDGDNDPVCDIGSYEFEGQPGPTPTATTPPTPTAMFTPTPSGTPTLMPTATPTTDPLLWKMYTPIIINSNLEN